MKTKLLVFGNYVQAIAQIVLLKLSSSYRKVSKTKYKIPLAYLCAHWAELVRAQDKQF